MININLGEIKGEHLRGEWFVGNRFNIEKDNTDIFSRNHRLILNENSFKAINGLIVTGSWEMKYKTDIIYNPQLIFHLEEGASTKAIITRLMIVDGHDNTSNREYILTLYFTSGLELILNRTFAN